MSFWVNLGVDIPEASCGRGFSVKHAFAAAKLN